MTRAAKKAPAKKAAAKKSARKVAPSSRNLAQMDDADLAQLGREYAKAKRQEQTGKARKEEIRDLIIPELNARGTRTLETGGVQVTKVSPTETVYVWAKLAKKLKKKQLRLIQANIVDKAKLAEAVEDGLIDAAVVEQCTQIVNKSEYVSVSIKAARPRR